REDGRRSKKADSELAVRCDLLRCARASAARKPDSGSEEPWSRLGWLRFQRRFRSPCKTPQRCGHASAGQLPGRTYALLGTWYGTRDCAGYRRSRRIKGTLALSIPEGHIRGLCRRPWDEKIRQEEVAESS